MALALELSRRMLEGRGAWRIHGGGFGGTIQVFIRNEAAADFVREMEKITGENTCHLLSIRPCGGIEVTTKL